MWSQKDRIQICIFCMIVFGIPISIYLLYLCSGSNPNVTLFSNVVVLLPAFGAIICKYVVKGDGAWPKRYYGFYSLVVFITVGLYFIELFTSISLRSIFLFIEYALAITGLFILIFEPRDIKMNYGLSFAIGNGKTIAALIFLFVILYFSRFALGFAVVGMDLDYIKSFIKQFDEKALFVLFLPFRFFLLYLPFWGEEYGWRYFLLPLLQKRFGRWLGVLIDGFLWGIWHIPMLAYSNAGDNLFYAGLVQIVFCICLTFFFSVVKEMTNNIWLIAFIHYLNNYFAVFVSVDSLSIGKIHATQFTDVVVFFAYNVIFVLPFIARRLYLSIKINNSTC